MNIPEFDYFGDQILMAITFAQHGFNPDELFVDTIRAGDTLPARDIFTEDNERWFMRFDSLPGQTSIKAVAVDNELLLLETSPLDLERVMKLVSEHGNNVTFDKRNMRFVSLDSSETLFTIEKTETLDEMDQRCLWIMNWAHLNPEDHITAIHAADMIYTHEAYIGDEEAVAQSGPMEMRLQLDVRQKLLIEQRPILSLKQVQTVRVQQRQELRMEIAPLLALQQRILRMTIEELVEYVTQDLSLEGQRKTTKTLHFVLAGQIKKAHPRMTWKQARAIGWKLITDIAA